MDKEKKERLMVFLEKCTDIILMFVGGKLENLMVSILNSITAKSIDTIMTIPFPFQPGLAMTCPPNTNIDSGPRVTTMMLRNYLHQLIDD